MIKLWYHGPVLGTCTCTDLCATFKNWEEPGGRDYMSAACMCVNTNVYRISVDHIIAGL